GAVAGGVFVAKGGRTRMLVGAGDESPIGGIFAKFSERVALNSAGAVAFTSLLKDAPVAQAVFVVEGGRPRKVVALGDGAPGGGVFSHFGLWPALSADGAGALKREAYCISYGGYSMKTLAAVISLWWVAVRGGTGSPRSSCKARGRTS